MTIFVFTHPPAFVKINAPLAEILLGIYSSQYIDRMKDLIELNNIKQVLSSYIACLRFYMQFKLQTNPKRF